jgi:prevent-host-death family protein
MFKVTATEFQRNFGQYEDKALVEPVSITSHGREKVVLLSKETFDKMSARTPKALLVSELSDEDLRNIEQAHVPEKYAGLDDELA